MSLTVGRTKVLTSLKDLRARWEKVRTQWDDPVAREFQKQFLDPLEGKARATVSAMEHMGDLVYKAKRDCTES